MVLQKKLILTVTGFLVIQLSILSVFAGERLNSTPIKTVLVSGIYDKLYHDNVTSVTSGNLTVNYPKKIIITTVPTDQGTIPVSNKYVGQIQVTYNGGADSFEVYVTDPTLDPESEGYVEIDDSNTKTSQKEGTYSGSAKISFTAAVDDSSNDDSAINLKVVVFNGKSAVDQEDITIPIVTNLDTQQTSVFDLQNGLENMLYWVAVNYNGDGNPYSYWTTSRVFKNIGEDSRSAINPLQVIKGIDDHPDTTPTLLGDEIVPSGSVKQGQSCGINFNFDFSKLAGQDQYNSIVNDFGIQYNINGDTSTTYTQIWSEAISYGLLFGLDGDNNILESTYPIELPTYSSVTISCLAFRFGTSPGFSDQLTPDIPLDEYDLDDPAPPRVCAAVDYASVNLGFDIKHAARYWQGSPDTPAPYFEMTYLSPFPWWAWGGCRGFQENAGGMGLLKLIPHNFPVGQPLVFKVYGTYKDLKLKKKIRQYLGTFYYKKDSSS